MKIGLVLSGGGGKGAYELGVWKGLKELSLDKYIEVFAGTSIGAFNAVLFAQDDMKKAEDLWDEVTMDKLIPISKVRLVERGLELALGWKCLKLIKKHMAKRMENGVSSKEGAIDIVDRYLMIDKIKELGKICYAACTELPSFDAKYFKLNDYSDDLARNIVVASATLPRIYDCTEVLGNKYIDGGASDNIPIEPVYNEGCDIIIVVLLSKDDRVDRTLYPNARIIEIFPRNLNESTLKGTLNLDDDAKKVRIDEGFRDTLNMLEPIIYLINNKTIIEYRKKHPILYKIKQIFNKQ